MTQTKRLIVSVALLAATSGCNDPLETARLNAMHECTETVRVGDVEMPRLSASARASCMERVRSMPRAGVNPCEELVRNDEGVWAYKLNENDRKSCAAGKR